jgi:POT family proton-dependent oligopeptide transporter
MITPSGGDDGVTERPRTDPPSAVEGIPAAVAGGPQEAQKDIVSRIAISGYRTSPDQTTTGWPPGIPYIVGNEACERFSFYGMKALLQPHLTALYLAAGFAAGRSAELASSTTHFFNAGVYALPMIGAILADRFAGKYRTILYLSLVYCLGHAVLAVAEGTLGGMYLGLTLIAIGSGGIKPCVSANVGDQFGKGNLFRLQTVYQIFYFSVNFGSFFSTILSPLTMKWWGPAWAFGIPGILMFIATVVFWMGRNKFVHVPPRPGGRLGLLDALSSAALFLVVGSLFFTGHLEWWRKAVVSGLFLVVGLGLFALRQRLRPDDGFLAITLYSLGRLFRRRPPSELPLDGLAAGVDVGAPLARGRLWGPAVRRFGLESAEGPVAVFKIMSVFLLVSVFWALFDQHATTWVVQAGEMNLTLWGETKVLPNQVQALNPLLVMLLIPLLNPAFGWLERKGLKMTPLRRITVGMFIASSAFVSVALVQTWIDALGADRVWVAWQVLPYLLITLAEVLVSITGLEFAYTQAPRRMKSTVMGFWLLTVSLGNALTGLLTRFGGLRPVEFFWTFAGLMAAAGLIFGLRAYFYVQRDFT